MQLPSIWGVLRAVMLGAALAVTAISGFTYSQPVATHQEEPAIEEGPSFVDLMTAWGHVGQLWFVLGDKRNWMGTAWVLKDKCIVTAGHVVDAGLKMYPGAEIVFRGERLRVLASCAEYEHDVAILVPENEKSNLLKNGLELADSEAAIRDKVWAMGFPRDAKVITEGEVKGNDNGLMAASYFSDGGISGAPVFKWTDSGLRVVGVSVRGYVSLRVRLPRSLFVRLEVLREFIEAATSPDDEGREAPENEPMSLVISRHSF